jgi:hypothetical protein
MFEEPLVMPDDDSMADELASLDMALAGELKYWRDANLPAPQQIYRMGDQEWDHHVHSEAFIELFRILGFTQEQLNYVYKKVALNEMQGLRRIAKEARKQQMSNQLTDGIIFKPPQS